VVVDLAAGDRRHLRVEKRDERTHDAALRLPALAEHDHVVSRDDCVGELRQHGVVVADDAGEERFARAKPHEQVAAHLLLHRLANVAAGAKLCDGGRQVAGHP